jgi:hypothetical protein
MQILTGKSPRLVCKASLEQRRATISALSVSVPLSHLSVADKRGRLTGRCAARLRSIGSSAAQHEITKIINRADKAEKLYFNVKRYVQYHG